MSYLETVLLGNICFCKLHHLCLPNGVGKVAQFAKVSKSKKIKNSKQHPRNRRKRLEVFCQRPPAWNFILKNFQYRCFPVNFDKFFRTFFLWNNFSGCLCRKTIRNPNNEGRTPPLFFAITCFLQSLWRTTNYVIWSWTDH